MIIIGVDPGTILTGFGIVKVVKNQVAHIKSGIIKPNPKLELHQKLHHIHQELEVQIKNYKPDIFCLETAFYGKNVQSTLKIGYVRGISMLLASQNDLEFFEYSPREIKKAIVGNGSASKEQVQYMIKNLLNLEKLNVKFDETDALAAAVCHSIKLNSFVTTKNNWKSFIEKNPDRIVE